jgi:hypothetical protein
MLSIFPEACDFTAPDRRNGRKIGGFFRRLDLAAGPGCGGVFPLTISCAEPDIYVE